MPIELEERGGKKAYSKDLLVGANPLFFYPFWLELDKYSTEENDKQYIYLRLLQKENLPNSPKLVIVNVFDAPYTIPRGGFQLTIGTTPACQQFQTNIRVYGQGIKEDVNRYLNINFSVAFWRKTDSDKLEDLHIFLDMKQTEVRLHWKKKLRRIPLDMSHALVGFGKSQSQNNNP